jgi:hypothetical protein
MARRHHLLVGGRKVSPLATGGSCRATPASAVQFRAGLFNLDGSMQSGDPVDELRVGLDKICSCPLS